MRFTFLLFSFAIATSVYAGSFTCRDPLASEEDFKVTKMKGSYAFQINGANRVRKFLAAIGVSEGKGDGTLKFEMPEADCRESKLSVFAVNCSGRNVKIAYASNEVIDAGFVVVDLIERTEISGISKYTRMVANVQSTIFDFGAKEPKMSHADYFNWFPIEQCKAQK